MSTATFFDFAPHVLQTIDSLLDEFHKGIEAALKAQRLA